eukprot:950076-Pelagomonas_calceolata.AAC.1
MEWEGYGNMAEKKEPCAKSWSVIAAKNAQAILRGAVQGTLTKHHGVPGLFHPPSSASEPRPCK